jgi:hypothetical protein
MSIKLNHPKLIAIIAPIVTLLAGYFGYTPVQELRGGHDVIVEVNVPKHEDQHAHTDWLPVIKAELVKARTNHERIHH